MLDRMRWHHAPALAIDDQPGEQAWMLRRCPKPSLYPVRLEPCLDIVPQFRIDDGFVQSGERPALVHDLAAIDAVRQHVVQRAATKAAPRNSCARPGKFGFQERYGSKLRIALEDRTNLLGGLVIDLQLAFMHDIAKWHIAAHPHAPGLGCGDLVADALPGDLALELREGQEHVERQPAHARGGVELLRHRDEGGTACIEGLDDPGKVEQRAGQPVDLVDHDDLHLAGPHIR